jgi:hypothetical protein
MSLRHMLLVACVSVLLPVVTTAVSANQAQAGVVTDDRLRALLVNDATCLIEYSRPRVNAFLRMAPETPNGEAQARLLGQSACMEGDRLSFQPNQLRGALFIALYQAQFGTSEPGLVDPGQEATVWPRSSDTRIAAMQSFAACVVRADPADARRAVLATPDSAAENVAIAGLRPQLDSCFPKGGTAAFNRMALSGLLAEALYRLAPSAPGMGN